MGRREGVSITATVAIEAHGRRFLPANGGVGGVRLEMGGVWWLGVGVRWDGGGGSARGGEEQL